METYISSGEEVMPNVSSTSDEVQEAKVITGSHHFKVVGYSHTRGIKPGHCLSSQQFKVGDDVWIIYFYPEGHRNVEDLPLYCAVFLRLLSSSRGFVRAKCVISLLDQSGEGKHLTLEKETRTFKQKDFCGSYRFLKITDLANSNFLKDDSLSIICKLEVLTFMTPRHLNILAELPDELGRHLGALLDSGEGADLTLDVKGEVFHAHKLILGARSSLFHTQLTGPENVTSLRVEDIEPPIFKDMLYFIYWGCLPEDGIRYTTEMIQDLLIAAKRFGIDGLVARCEVKMCDFLTIETLASTLALTEQYHAFRLKKVCLEFARANLAAVMQRESFNLMSPVLQSEIQNPVAPPGIASNFVRWMRIRFKRLFPF